MRKFLCLLIALLLLLPAVAVAQGQGEGEVKRVLLALYSSKDNPSPRMTLAHRFLEMPLNHMGYYLRYVNLEQALPPVDDDVKGVIVWLPSGRFVEDGDAYLAWLQQAVDSGKKLLIFDDIGLDDKYRRKEGAMDRLNSLLSSIGLRDMDSYNSVTYQGSVLYQNPEIVGFERALPESLPPYSETIAIPGVGVSHLKVLASKTPEVIHDLVVTGPGGGYVAGGYSLFEGYPILPIKDIELQKHLPEEERDRPDPVQQWYINPFEFLKLALDEKGDWPVPDVTTQEGLRIYYSHIDGDGWNNLTQIKKYSGGKWLSAQVIQHEIIEAFPDMPVNVSIIAGEMDRDCYGLSASRKVAEDIFALPNVEPSSHTYSHPLFWDFFREYDPMKEVPILGRYPKKPRGQSLYGLLFGKEDKETVTWDAYEHPESAEEQAKAKTFERLLNKEVRGELDAFRYYDTPRSYACEPFDLDKEIRGSIDYVRSIAPEEKRDRIRLVQWSGDTSPFEEALEATRNAALLNINGGDSRYDSEYPSYASVSPIGAQVGEERQIYSSNSNENTYTNLWTDRFFGFIYLQTTVRNTEIPMRVQPFNIYYHMFSGEKQASLAALKSNVEYAKGQELSRIFASDFAEIADGFYAARITPLGQNRWRIDGRGKLNTVRVDNAVLKAVDFGRSSGVIGQRYYQGSLYVALNPDVPSPILAIKKKNTEFLYEEAVEPYVIHASWLINKLISVKKSLMFAANGYGDGKFSLRFPGAGGHYEVVVSRENKELLRQVVIGNADGVLSFTLPVNAVSPVNITITPRDATEDEQAGGAS